MSLNVIDLVVRPSSHCYPVRACTAGVKQCLRACVCVCVCTLRCYFSYFLLSVSWLHPFQNHTW